MATIITYPGASAKKTGDDGAVAYILEPPMTDKAFRKDCARLIQKIYEVDLLVCPSCQGEIRVIAVIEEQDGSSLLTTSEDVVTGLSAFSGKVPVPYLGAAGWPNRNHPPDNRNPPKAGSCH